MGNIVNWDNAVSSALSVKIDDTIPLWNQPCTGLSGIPSASQSLLKVIPLDRSGLDVSHPEPTALVMSVCIILASSGMDGVPVCQTLPAEFMSASTTCKQN
jgi:hypothetical protein